MLNEGHGSLQPHDPVLLSPLLLHLVQLRLGAEAWVLVAGASPWSSVTSQPHCDLTAGPGRMATVLRGRATGAQPGQLPSQAGEHAPSGSSVQGLAHGPTWG